MKSISLALSLTALAAGPLAAQSIIGSWFITRAGQAKSDAVLTFLADGTYTMAEDGDSKLDPNGRDGMERGTYQWNPVTKAFSIDTLVDTSGEWGLSDADFVSASISGTNLTITDDGGSFTLRRVASANKLVGSWYLKEGKGYAVVTFLADGSYFMVQDGKSGGGGRTGVERGTYQWNSKTKAFTRKVTLDTNGTWGFSDNLKRTLTLSANRITLNVEGEGKFTLLRVVAP